MSYAKRSATQEIKARINIVDIVRRYVALQRHGNRWVAPCPFHQETKPSFSVNEEEGFFHCFGCQASGDLFDFYAKINGLDFRDALAQLAEEAGIKLETHREKSGGEGKRESDSRRSFFKMYEFAAAYYVRNLASPDGAACRDYLSRRKISAEIIENFALGWSSQGWKGLADSFRRAGFSQEEAVKAGLLSASDKGNAFDRFRGRLMFPIHSLANRTIAFGGRIIAPDEDAAKYINSADSPIYKKGEHLYGLAHARRGISAKRSAMLTEGYMDVLTLHQYGYTNACGVLGTALTTEQVKRLSGFCSSLELLFDGDGPGRKAAMRGVEMAVAKGMRCSVVLMPEGEDIDSLLHSSGKDAFEQLRANAPDGLDFCIRTLREASPREAVEWVKNFLRQVEQPELLSSYVSRLARGLDIDESSLRQELPAGIGAASKRSGPREAIATEDLAVKGKGLEGALMRYLVRFPHHLPTLRDCGAEFLLSKVFYRDLWTLIAACAPVYAVEDIFSQLTDTQKEFWVATRMNGPGISEQAPETEQYELSEICERLKSIGAERQVKNCLQAIRHTSSGADYDVELLRAMTEAARRKHGEY